MERKNKDDKKETGLVSAEGEKNKQNGSKWLQKTEKYNKYNIENKKKIFHGFTKKKKTAAIFFDMEKVYDKINRNKTFEELENIGVQGRWSS